MIPPEALNTKRINLFYSARMENTQRSKRRRVYSVEPSTIFSEKYLNSLLPALIRINERSFDDKDDKDDNKKAKIVRYEVDMALVLSSQNFHWSRALKLKLESDMTAKDSRKTSTQLTSSKHNEAILENVNGFISSTFSGKNHERMQMCQTIKEEEEEEGNEEMLQYRVKTLRRLLPGGNEIGLDELFSEVESYLVCLELQVRILRSLVDRN